MSKRRRKHRHRRRLTSQLKHELLSPPLVTQEIDGSFMTEQFQKGDFVKLEYAPDSSLYPLVARRLSKFVGKVGYIREVYLTGFSVMYEVLFKNYSCWIPEDVLSFVGRPIPTEKSQAGRILKFYSTDTWGERFSVTTQPNPDNLPGWITEISHFAYANGESVIIAFCVSEHRAIEMHQEWVKILTCGPLPVSIEEAGLGSWKAGAVIHPRASWYTAIPLGY